MNCRSCGAALPSGVSFCTYCGSPTPYNTANQGAPAAPSSPYQPTVAASPPSSPSSAASYAETIAASPYSGTPPTGYGDAASPLNPYAPPPPQAPQTPYSMPGTPSPSPYGTPPPSPYGAPSAPPPYGYNNAAGYPPVGVPGTYSVPPQPKRGSKVGLIIGLVVLALVVVCGGSFAILYSIGKNQADKVTTNLSATVTAAAATTGATPTTAATPTPAATPTTSTSSGSGSSPSGNSIDPTAAAIISNLKTANGIDQNTSEPTGVSSTFTVNKKFYLIFDIESNGKDGYVQAKIYLKNQFLDSSILHHHAQYNVGYFPATYSHTGDAAAEMYWCTKADCSDAKLAAVATFTITP
jgi:hypothetical protein